MTCMIDEGRREIPWLHNPQFRQIQVHHRTQLCQAPEIGPFLLYLKYTLEWNDATKQEGHSKFVHQGTDKLIQPLLSSSITFCPLRRILRAPLPFFEQFVLICSYFLIHNNSDRLSVDMGEKIRPFPVVTFLTVSIRVQEYCEVDVCFVCGFIPGTNVLK